MTIDLFDANAPQTVANFKALAAKKFYKGMVVHRIVPETLVQMGDPLSRKKDRSATGTGGPGYTLPAEIGRKHVRGAVAMAALPPTLNPSRASNGSQFYIVLRAQTGPGQGLHRVRAGDERAGVSGFHQPARAGHE